MKIHINRKPVVGPWGGGNMWVKSAYEAFPKLGIDIVDIDAQPDVIFVVGMGPENGSISAIDAIRYKKTVNRDTKVVLRVNENDARKATKGVDDTIRFFSQEMDHVVFVSEWLQNYFQPSNWRSKTSYIHNGVDTDIFKSNKKINNGKINIVTHHWSDNYMKGFDVYDEIDVWLSSHPEFTFTYIGRDRGSFRNTKVVKPLFGSLLGEELGRYDVYVSASRYDPGPNHVIESLACGIPTYVHVQGGGCVEFAGQDHTYRTSEELLNILMSKSYELNTSWKPSDWSRCMTEFAVLARNLHEKHR